MDDLDHRHLGVKLKLWHLQEDAPGMVFWHPVRPLNATTLPAKRASRAKRVGNASGVLTG